MDVTSDTAVCVDRQGNEVRVPLLIQRSKGQLPSVGENWLVSQDFGTWAFQAFIGNSTSDFPTGQISNGATLSLAPPNAPSMGDIWINSATGIWGVWNGTQWVPTTAAGGAVISPTAPQNPSVGLLWCDSSNGNIINIWDGTQWDQAPVGSNAIVEGAIVAGLVAAGAIDGTVINGAIINGGQISGADFVTSGTTGAYFIYTSGGSIVQTFKAGGSGTWVCPAGVTSVQVESVGAGGGGGAGADAGGGGGGEYSAQVIAVTPAGSYPYTVGPGGPAGSAGTASLFTGDAATVQGHGGQAGTPTAAGLGGTGSSNTTKFKGGQGFLPSAGSKVVTLFDDSGTFNWTAPAGITSVLVECWGAGGGGTRGSGTGADIGGYGGGGGAYARLNALTVIPGHSYALTVGLGGQAGTSSGAAKNGAASTFGTNSCVAAGGKASAGAIAQGGQISASKGDVLHSGGSGGSPGATGGSGGGGSGGTTTGGNNGGTSSTTDGGPGGAARQGGGAGGDGGALGSHGSPGQVPGGGGGGGGGGGFGGGAGASGQVQLTYTLSLGGGGGASGGAAAAGRSATGQQGALAVSGGGPGGNGGSAGPGSAPSIGPGGGGGGGSSGSPGGAGSDGQVRLTYLSGTPVLSGSIAGASGNDPFAGTAYPEGAKFDNVQAVSTFKVGASVISLSPSGDSSGADDSAAIAAVAGANVRLFLLPGAWNLNAGLPLSTGMSVLGAGGGSTVIHQRGTAVPGMVGTDVASILLEGFDLIGPSSGSQHGISFIKSSASNIPFTSIRDVRVSHFGADGVNIQTPISTGFDNVNSFLNGGNGFTVSDVSACTSCDFRNCYANANTSNGYSLTNLQYSSLTGCACDSNANGYVLTGCHGVVLSGCGAENTVADSYIITGSKACNIFGAVVFGNNHYGIHVTGSSKRITIGGAEEISPGSATNFIITDSGTTGVIWGAVPVTADSIGGTWTNVDGSA
jgi:hypothetical protein